MTQYPIKKLKILKSNLQEVKKLIHDININKSSAIENIPTKVLKTAFSHTPEMLVKIFNLVFFNWNHT